MKLTRIAAIALPAAAAVTAAVAVAAVSGPLAVSANAGTTHNAGTRHPAAQPPKVAVYDCANKPVVRPKVFDIFCDGSDALVKLNWTSWNGSEATGTGTQYIDNCTPNCARGKWTHENVVVVLWRGQPAAHHKGHKGQQAYTKMTLLYPAAGKTSTITPPGAY
jgi:hypothetical protein